jgi:hypothetical protein
MYFSEVIDKFQNFSDCTFDLLLASHALDGTVDFKGIRNYAISVFYFNVWQHYANGSGTGAMTDDNRETCSLCIERRRHRLPLIIRCVLLGTR